MARKIRKKRDLDRERDELLRLMNDSIPKQIKKHIEKVCTLALPSRIVKVQTSYKGAGNANTK